jgi:hypothetical protein
MDMVYDLKERSYAVYVVLRMVENGKESKNKNVLVQLIFDNVKEEKPVPKITVEKDILTKYPDNCGDKLKVSQDLIIVGCSTNGATNIITRNEEKINLVVANGSKLSMSDFSISLIEHNTHIGKIYKQKLEKDNASWMKKYLGTSQTYVFISSSKETLAWQILSNPNRNKVNDRHLVI